MRFAFFGTAPFAAIILERLLDAGLIPQFVVTQPDAISRRGNARWPSAVADVATQASLPLGKPDKLRDPALQTPLIAALHDLDCVVLAAYGRIISPVLLDAPRKGWINVHASLLPRWRGAAPLQRAILAGDELTGVSIMRMEAGLDTGPYCAQTQAPVGDKNCDQLEEALAAAGAQLLLAELPQIVNDTATWHEQDQSQVTYAQKIEKHELDLSPAQAPLTNVRRVRASSNSAPARLTLFGKGKEIPLRALSAELRPLKSLRRHGAGTVLCDSGDHLALISTAHNEYCAITSLQPAGKRPQSSADFLRGLRSGERLRWR